MHNGENALSLQAIDDDTLILIFGFLTIPGILALRRTSQRMRKISKFRIVWRNACINNVLSCGFPFPNLPLSSIPNLELSTKRAYMLGLQWKSRSPLPRQVQVFDANRSICIEEVKFIPGRDYLLTVSKGIWSVITAWSVKDEVRKITEWCPRGAIFNGFAVNTDPESEAAVAVSVKYESASRTDILSLRCKESNEDPIFESIATFHRPLRPIELQGDIIAFSDDISTTIISNWKRNTNATLRHASVPGETMWELDRCMQVVFAFESILVIRARSIHLFPKPTLKPDVDNLLVQGAIARHSFGWVDGISVSLPSYAGRANDHRRITHDPIHILIRAESDDPWSQEQHNLQFFSLEPNSLYGHATESVNTISPYLFPPRLRSEVSSAHGSLRCAGIALKSCGTAVWVHPRNRAVAGLLPSDINLTEAPVPLADERLVAAVFPGHLNPQGETVEAITLYENRLNDWTCVDYDEDMGRIALGSNSGSVTMMEL